MGEKIRRVVLSVGYVLSCFFIMRSNALRQDSTFIRQVTDKVIHDDDNNNTYSYSVNNLKQDYEISRALRDEPPSSYLLKVVSFSEIESRPNYYESAPFDAAGFKWRLIFYPNGNPKDNGRDHISLYVRKEDSPKTVAVDLKLFVYNQKQNKYLTVQDGTGKIFNGANREWGFGQLLQHSAFYDSSNGYLVSDSCTLGAEITALAPASKKERVTLMEKPPGWKYTWQIDGVARIGSGTVECNVFRVGDVFWKLRVTPKGDEDAKNKALSVFLCSSHYAPDVITVWPFARFKLRVRNQRNSDHVERQYEHLFAIPARDGENWFIPLGDLQSKGFLVNDRLIVEVEFDVVSSTKVLDDMRQGLTTEHESSNAVAETEPSSDILKTDSGITRSLRDQSPSTYTVTLINFSQFKTFPRHYETHLFNAVGHRWRLYVYPNGNANDGGKDHVSLYLKTQYVETLPKDWSVDVDLKFFVHDRIKNKYLTIQDGKGKRFNQAKYERGFAKLLPLSALKDPNNGYLVNDAVTLGVEVALLKRSEKREILSFLQNPEDGKFAWQIRHINKQNSPLYSDEFSVGDRRWRVVVYPKGDKSGEGNSLSVYLNARGYVGNAVTANTFAACRLRLRNQRGSRHLQRTVTGWFNLDAISGFEEFVSLDDLYDESKGYVVNNMIAIEAEFQIVSVTKVFNN